MSHSSTTELILENGKHRLFPTLSTYLVLNACFAKAFLGEEKWAPGDWFFYQCKAYGQVEVRLPLVGPIENAKLGQDADYIKVTVAPSTGRPAPEQPQPNVHAFVFKMLAPSFTEFYENHVGEVKAHFGDSEKWPDHWRFARVVRNAMAHGWKLNITTAKAAPVIWKGLAYGPAQNGRAIFGTDLEIGDILVLMFLMSASLDGIQFANTLRGL